MWVKLSIIALMHAKPQKMGNMLIVNAIFEDMVRGSEYVRLGPANINKPIITGIETIVKDHLTPTLAVNGVFVFTIALLGSMRLIIINEIHAIIVI